jgi:nuclear pore complex protein Nup107
VLYSSSYTLSSEYLTHCMNLAVQVSENEHLSQSFIKSRRMGELVDALAITSKSMVRLGATRDKRQPGGETQGIWHVEPAGEQDEEFHEFVRETRQHGGPS